MRCPVIKPAVAANYGRWGMLFSAEEGSVTDWLQEGAAPPVLTALLAMLLAALLTLSLHPQSAAANNARPPTIRVEELVTGLSIPWDLTFTPDETMLFTQRGGVLSARPTDGTVQTVTADFSDLQPSGGRVMGMS